MKKLLFTFGITFVLIGCGGGGNTTGGGINPNSIDLKKAINEGKVPEYDDTDPIENRYLAVVNYIRSLNIKCNDSLGYSGPVGKLQWSDELKDAAKEHNEDMAAQNYFAHKGSGKDTDLTAQALGLSKGSMPADRAQYNGYSRNVGENIHSVKSSQQIDNDEWIGAFEAFLQSKHGHCSNMLESRYKDFAMHEKIVERNGTQYRYQGYWTQMFGVK